MSVSRVGACSVIAVLVCLGSFSVGWASGTCTFDTRGNTMYLQSSCTTESTITVPDGYTLDGGGFLITATESTEGGWNGAIITNEGPRANIVNVSLTADNLACICRSGNDRLQGIRMASASGRVENNNLEAINKGADCACQEGIGIAVTNAPFDGTGDPELAPNVKVSNNTVKGYQKGGIVVTGNVAPTIVSNQVQGWGETDVLAQNGIQVSYGATGLVEGNTVRGNWFTGNLDEGATGIVIFESDDNQLLTNNVVDSQVGIAIDSWCSYAPSASRNRALGNLIDEADYGIAISAYVFDPPWSNCGPQVTDNTLTGNKGATSEGSVAWSLYGIYACTDCPGVLDATGNRTVLGWTYGFDLAIDKYVESPPVAGGTSSDAAPSLRARGNRALKDLVDDAPDFENFVVQGNVKAAARASTGGRQPRVAPYVP